MAKLQTRFSHRVGVELVSTHLPLSCLLLASVIAQTPSLPVFGAPTTGISAPYDVVVDGVNTRTRDFTYSVTDLTIPGDACPKLALTRTYNSADTADGPFGKGWTCDFVKDASLIVRYAAGHVAKVEKYRRVGGKQTLEYSLVLAWNTDQNGHARITSASSYRESPRHALLQTVTYAYANGASRSVTSERSPAGWMTHYGYRRWIALQKDAVPVDDLLSSITDADGAATRIKYNDTWDVAYDTWMRPYAGHPEVAEITEPAGRAVDFVPAVSDAGASGCHIITHHAEQVSDATDGYSIRSVYYVPEPGQIRVVTGWHSQGVERCYALATNLLTEEDWCAGFGWSHHVPAKLLALPRIDMDYDDRRHFWTLVDMMHAVFWQDVFSPGVAGTQLLGGGIVYVRKRYTYDAAGRRTKSVLTGFPFTPGQSLPETAPPLKYTSVESPPQPSPKERVSDLGEAIENHPNPKAPLLRGGGGEGIPGRIRYTPGGRLLSEETRDAAGHITRKTIRYERRTGAFTGRIAEIDLSLDRRPGYRLIYTYGGFGGEDLTREALVTGSGETWTWDFSHCFSSPGPQMRRIPTRIVQNCPYLPIQPVDYLYDSCLGELGLVRYNVLDNDPKELVDKWLQDQHPQQFEFTWYAHDSFGRVYDIRRYRGEYIKSGGSSRNKYTPEERREFFQLTPDPGNLSGFDPTSFKPETSPFDPAGNPRYLKIIEYDKNGTPISDSKNKIYKPVPTELLPTSRTTPETYDAFNPSPWTPLAISPESIELKRTGVEKGGGYTETLSENGLPLMERTYDRSGHVTHIRAGFIGARGVEGVTDVDGKGQAHMKWKLL